MEQVIETDYNKDLVEEYKNNYIMEEEGIGTEEGEVYGIQDTVNTDTPEEMTEEGVVIEYES